MSGANLVNLNGMPLNLYRSMQPQSKSRRERESKRHEQTLVEEAQRNRTTALQQVVAAPPVIPEWMQPLLAGANTVFLEKNVQQGENAFSDVDNIKELIEFIIDGPSLTSLFKKVAESATVDEGEKRAETTGEKVWQHFEAGPSGGPSL